MKRLILIGLLVVIISSLGYSQTNLWQGGLFVTFWRDSSGTLVPVPAGKPLMANIFGSVAVNTDIVPLNDSTYDLGSYTSAWDTAFIDDGRFYAVTPRGSAGRFGWFTKTAPNTGLITLATAGDTLSDTAWRLRDSSLVLGANRLGRFVGEDGAIVYLGTSSTTVKHAAFLTTALSLNSSMGLVWTSGTSATSGVDLSLFRDNSYTLGMRSTSASTPRVNSFNIYSSYQSTSNNSYLTVGNTDTSAAKILTSATGKPTPSLTIGAKTASWTYDTTGAYYSSTIKLADSSLYLGASRLNKIKSLSDNNMTITFGSTDEFLFSTTQFYMGSDNLIGWGSSTPTGTVDTRLGRDGVGILGLRRAQTEGAGAHYNMEFRVAGGYASATNYAYVALKSDTLTSSLLTSATGRPTPKLTIGAKAATLQLDTTYAMTFFTGDGSSTTDSSIVFSNVSGSPRMYFYGTDGDEANIGINTSDAMIFNNAPGGYSFDSNVIIGASNYYDIGNGTMRISSSNVARSFDISTFSAGASIVQQMRIDSVGRVGIGRSHNPATVGTALLSLKPGAGSNQLTLNLVEAYRSSNATSVFSVDTSGNEVLAGYLVTTDVRASDSVAAVSVNASGLFNGGSVADGKHTFGDTLNISSGVLQMGGTTVIDASRNITAAQVTNTILTTLGSTSQSYIYRNTTTNNGYTPSFAVSANLTSGSRADGFSGGIDFRSAQASATTYTTGNIQNVRQNNDSTGSFLVQNYRDKSAIDVFEIDWLSGTPRTTLGGKDGTADGVTYTDSLYANWLSLTVGSFGSLTTTGDATIGGLIKVDTLYNPTTQVTINDSVKATYLGLNTATLFQHVLAIGVSATTKLNGFNLVNTDINKDRTDPQKATDTTAVSFTSLTSGKWQMLMTGATGDTTFWIDSLGWNRSSQNTYGGAYISDDHIDSIIVGSSSVAYTVGAVQPPSGYKLTSGGVLKNVTVQDSSLTIQKAGTYLIRYSVSALSVGIAGRANFYIYVNDTKQEKSGAIASLTNGAYTNQSGGMIYTASANDIVKLKVISPDDSAGTIAVQYANFTVSRID